MKKKNKMRYFLISFRWKKDWHEGYGKIWFHINRFPSLEFIKNKAGDEDIIILNIYEFKNKKDYNDFRGDKKCQ